MVSRHLAFGLLVASLFALGCSKGAPSKTAEEPKPTPSAGPPTSGQPGSQPTPDPAKKPSGEKPPAEKPSGEKPPAEKPSAEKPIEVAAEQWAKEAVKDVGAFDKKYRGKMIRVIGKVKRTTLMETIWLETGMKAADYPDEVQVALNCKDAKQVSGLKPGDTVVVEGEYHSINITGGPICENCRVIEKK